MVLVFQKVSKVTVCIPLASEGLRGAVFAYALFLKLFQILPEGLHQQAALRAHTEPCVFDLFGRYISVPVAKALVLLPMLVLMFSNFSFMRCASKLFPQALFALVSQRAGRTLSLQLNCETDPFTVMRHIMGTRPFFSDCLLR